VIRLHATQRPNWAWYHARPNFFLLRKTARNRLRAALGSYPARMGTELCVVLCSQLRGAQAMGTSFSAWHGRCGQRPCLLLSKPFS